MRGVKTKKAAEEFLQPDWERDTHDPLLLKGALRAVKRIFKAMDESETIAIWSDYDMDGIPDLLDSAPDDPEDYDGWQDEDGVPDRDNDHDGIPDRGLF